MSRDSSLLEDGQVQGKKGFLEGSRGSWRGSVRPFGSSSMDSASNHSMMRVRQSKTGKASLWGFSKIGDEGDTEIFDETGKQMPSSPNSEQRASDTFGSSDLFPNDTDGAYQETNACDRKEDFNSHGQVVGKKKDLFLAFDENVTISDRVEGEDISGNSGLQTGTREETDAYGFSTSQNGSSLDGSKPGPIRKRDRLFKLFGLSSDSATTIADEKRAGSRGSKSPETKPSTEPVEDDLRTDLGQDESEGIPKNLMKQKSSYLRLDEDDGARDSLYEDELIDRVRSVEMDDHGKRLSRK